MKKDGSIWYNGKFGLKKAGVKTIDVNDKDKIREIIKCSNDLKYFVETYCHIVSLDDQLTKVTLRDYQQEQMDLYLKERHIALNFPRQSGKTIGTVLYFVWKLLFNKYFKIICLANKDDVAMEIVKKVELICENLPVWLQQGVVACNAHKMEFENHSSIVAKATTTDAGRSASANIVYIDECAFIKKNIWEDFYKGVSPTISSGKTTQMIITSTPNGLNHWWKIVTEAKNKRNNFVCMELDWKKVPLYTEKFKEDEIRSNGIAHWESEYECKFLGSAGTLIPGRILETLIHKAPIEEKIIFKEKYKLKIYNYPQEHNNYILTLDPSEGLGGESDKSGIHVWDISQKHIRKQVATMYTNELAELEAPYVIKHIARLYNSALVLAENNKCSIILEDLIRECDYDNLYIHTDFRKGIRMTESSRRKGLRQMLTEFESERFIINDFDTIHELSVFINKRGKYQADDGENDDLVMSLNLLCWLMADRNRYRRFIADKVNYIRDVHDIPEDDFERVFIFFDGNDF